MNEDFCAKKCSNSTDHHNCNHCGVGCTDDNCDKSVCEIFGMNGNKHLVCMCPKTSCRCLGRDPDKIEQQMHYIDIYSKELEILDLKYLQS
jgi:hypothetical protein